jgi:hypothetical protein
VSFVELVPNSASCLNHLSQGIDTSSVSYKLVLNVVLESFSVHFQESRVALVEDYSELYELGYVVAYRSGLSLELDYSGRIEHLGSISEHLFVYVA